ncbi:MAG: GAF domain-containing protein [Actinobacteria bacterium]|nr:MAG: GAF domain-containing protein [Actinomycetota bacterium]
MSGPWPIKRSLANRYTLLVAVLVAFTTLILASALARGVYSMALREETARQRAQSDLVVRDVSSRLLASYRVLRTLADRDVIRGVDDRAVGKALASAYVENAEYLRGVALIDLDGDSRIAYPAASQLPPDELVRSADLTQGVAYIWMDATDETPGALWVVVPTRREGGHDALLVGVARTGFIDEVLKQVSFSEKRPTALIADAGSNSVFTAGDPQAYLNSSITFEPSPDDVSVGAALITSSGGERFAGVFAAIPGLPGLDWRVLVTEPESVVAAETWQALKPAVFAWGASSSIAMVLALVSVAFLARPLRLLDERARAAASGVMLEPMPVKRNDEIGRLMASFNSVVLRLNGMHDISQLLASASDIDEVLDRILASLSHILGARDVDILLLEDDGAWLRLARASGSVVDAVGVRIPLKESAWLMESVDSGELERFSGDGREDPLLRLHGVYAHDTCALAVPLAKGRSVLGVVAIVCDARQPFSDAEIEVARSFAAQASVALDNARLFEDERRSRRDAEALQKVAEIMSGSAALPDSLVSIAAIEADLLGADRSWVFLEGPIDPSAEVEQASRACFVLWRRLQAERGLSAHALPVAFSAEDEDGDVRALLGMLGVQSVVMTPVSVHGELAGLLVMGWDDRTYSLDRHAIELGSAIGQQVALAIENVRLFDEARTRADNLETIFRISQAVSSSLQSKVVLNRVLDVVQKILSADAVMLMTLDVDRSLMVVPMARGILNPEMLRMEFRVGEDVPGEVFERREPVSLPDLSVSDSPLSRIASKQELGSAVFVPLLARGRSIGVLAVFARSTSAFSEADVELLRTFATQAALAIDNAEMFSREHHVATVLQHSILPTRLPTIEGIESASVYVPAGSEVEIGGDYYDLFPAPDGRVVIAIGDVCGKGVEAATKTSMIKYSIRGMIAAGSRPSAVLAELNTALVAAGDPSDIVTLWLGMLEIESGRLEWANGGHPPAMLLQPSTGEIVRLGTTGALLGAIRDAAYGDADVVVEPGGMVLLYTDGVTEARNRGRFFGEGRVRRGLRQGGTAAVVTQRMLAMVQRFSRGDLRDDAAILAVLRQPERDDGICGRYADLRSGTPLANQTHKAMRSPPWKSISSTASMRAFASCI